MNTNSNEQLINLYTKYMELKENNKLDTKFAEIINIIIYITSIIIFIILNKYISITNSLCMICLYYLISKMLNFFMFGSRNKRRKERILINKNIIKLKSTI